MDRIKKEKSQILDVGCLRGNEIQEISQRLWDNGHSIVGVDLGSRDKVITKWDNKYPLIQKDILNCIFPKNSFDYIIASHVIQHIGMPFWGREDPDDYDNNGDKIFLEKANHWLKDDGKVFIVTIIGPEAQIFEYHESCTYRIYDTGSLAGILTRSGFKITDSLRFDGAHCSRQRVKDAMAIVLEAEIYDRS